MGILPNDFTQRSQVDGTEEIYTQTNGLSEKFTSVQLADWLNNYLGEIISLAAGESPISLTDLQSIILDTLNGYESTLSIFNDNIENNTKTIVNLEEALTLLSLSNILKSVTDALNIQYFANDNEAITGGLNETNVYFNTTDNKLKAVESSAIDEYVVAFANYPTSTQQLEIRSLDGGKTQFNERLVEFMMEINKGFCMPYSANGVRQISIAGGAATDYRPEYDSLVGFNFVNEGNLVNILMEMTIHEVNGNIFPYNGNVESNEIRLVKNDPSFGADGLYYNGTHYDGSANDYNGTSYIEFTFPFTTAKEYHAVTFRVKKTDVRIE